jgi:hypothetical protein
VTTTFKACLAFGLSLAIIVAATWHGPPRDRWKWFFIMISVPFGMWVVNTVLRYDDERKGR